MRFHPLSEKYKTEIKENAKKVGLDKIDFQASYFVTKIKSKKTDEDMEQFQIRGVPCLLGNETLLKLFFDSHKEWFMTSLVVSTEVQGNNYIVETANSIYLLEKES